MEAFMIAAMAAGNRDRQYEENRLPAPPPPEPLAPTSSREKTPTRGVHIINYGGDDEEEAPRKPTRGVSEFEWKF